MAKNNQNIAMIKELTKLRKRIDRDATEFYGSMAIVLHDRGYSQDDIETFIADVGELWGRVYNEDINIVDLCMEVTGIDIRDDIVGH